MSDSCGELLEESAVDLTAAAALTADWLARAADSRSTQRDISSISERESRVCNSIYGQKEVLCVRNTGIKKNYFRMFWHELRDFQHVFTLKVTVA